MKWLNNFCLSFLMISGATLTAQMGNYPYSSHNDMSMNDMTMNQINWLTSYDQAVAQSKVTSKPILILFTGTTWCPACVKLERDVLSHPDFIQAIASRFIFLKAEFPNYSQGGTNASPYKPLSDRYNISTFPTMLVINSGGHPLNTIPYQSGGVQAYIQKFAQYNQDKMQMNAMPQYSR